MAVEPEEITFVSLRDNVERNFRHVAENKNVPFMVDFDHDLPRAFSTDPKRLQQIIKNLLSNAFKFTGTGHVTMNVRPVSSGWSQDHPSLNRAGGVIALAITDTGIGIAPEKQRLIFEAFQQADAGTARKYGGTGLGLAISRELATLLGGEIRLMSVQGEGSTFTLYLPLHYVGPTETVSPALGSRRPNAAMLPVLPVATRREDQRRPRRSRLGRSRPAHRRRRSALRAHPPRPRARPRFQRHCGDARPPGHFHGAAVFSPPPLRSIFSCPTCSAGPC